VQLVVFFELVLVIHMEYNFKQSLFQLADTSARHPVRHQAMDMSTHKHMPDIQYDFKQLLF
jgi:hypothetical protein